MRLFLEILAVWLVLNAAFVLARHLVTLPAKTKAKADRQVVLDVWDGKRA